jgi:hypothetical protein
MEREPLPLEAARDRSARTLEGALARATIAREQVAVVARFFALRGRELQRGRGLARLVDAVAGGVVVIVAVKNFAPAERTGERVL